MRSVFFLVYSAMAVWLLIAAALRVVLLLGGESGLDPLPFISGGLGLVALLSLLPALARRRTTRRNRTPSDLAVLRAAARRSLRQ